MKKLVLGVYLAVTFALVIAAVVTASDGSSRGWSCTYVSTEATAYAEWVVVRNRYNCVFTPADPSLNFIYIDKGTIPRTLFFEDQPITVN